MAILHSASKNVEEPVRTGGSCPWGVTLWVPPVRPPHQVGGEGFSALGALLHARRGLVNDRRPAKRPPSELHLGHLGRADHIELSSAPVRPLPGHDHETCRDGPGVARQGFRDSLVRFVSGRLRQPEGEGRAERAHLVRGVAGTDQHALREVVRRVPLGRALVHESENGRPRRVRNLLANGFDERVGVHVIGQVHLRPAPVLERQHEMNRANKTLIPEQISTHLHFPKR